MPRYHFGNLVSHNQRTFIEVLALTFYIVLGKMGNPFLIAQEVEEAVARAVAPLKRQIASHDTNIDLLLQSARSKSSANDLPGPPCLITMVVSKQSTEDEAELQVESYDYASGEAFGGWGELPEQEALLQDFLVMCGEPTVITFQAHLRGFIQKQLYIRWAHYSFDSRVL